MTRTMSVLEAIKTIKPGQMFKIPFNLDDSDSIVVRWEKGESMPTIANQGKHRFLFEYLTPGIYDIEEQSA